MGQTILGKVQSNDNEEHSGRPSVVSDELVHAVEDYRKREVYNALVLEFSPISWTVMYKLITGIMEFQKCVTSMPDCFVQMWPNKSDWALARTSASEVFLWWSMFAQWWWAERIKSGGNMAG